MHWAAILVWLQGPCVEAGHPGTGFGLFGFGLFYTARREPLVAPAPPGPILRARTEEGFGFGFYTAQDPLVFVVVAVSSSSDS